MCGISGYVGSGEASKIILDGLQKLEYRGYDSAGIAVRGTDGEVHVVKAKGRLKVLSDKIDGGNALPGNIGIGHTRWATHGEPSESNAHPHISGERVDDSSVVGVHNGIIENYQELKEKLQKNGCTFYSETDTEVAVKLVGSFYAKCKNPLESLSRAMMRIRGSYALAVMFKDFPDQIWVARKDSPLIIGVADGESFIASDVPAILKYTRQVYYIDNLEIGRICAGKVDFFNIEGDGIEKVPEHILWDAEAAEKGGYEHFMIKEIHEQPKAMADTLSSLIHDGRIDLSASGIDDDAIRSFRSITIIACGSAWHVGMEAQYIFESLTHVPVRVELASEYRYRDAGYDPDGLAVVISQSGETADSLAALREAKKRGIKTLAIVNVLGSSIARESDYFVNTLAGPEIAVATTKAYSAQLCAAEALAVHFALVLGKIDESRYSDLIKELLTLPEKVKVILEEKQRIQWFSSKYANAKDAFFIGRGIDYAVCLEGSLKLKEVSYIHSEAYAAGELKHGTISLIENGTLVAGVLTQETLFEKTLSNMVECKTRGAYLMAVTTRGHYEVEDYADFVIYVPRTDALFEGNLAVIPLQLLGYYTSVAKGIDVDKPRNLAKSVTVE